MARHRNNGALMKQISGKETATMAWKWSSSDSNGSSRWGDYNNTNSTSSCSSNDSFCHYGEDDDNYDEGKETRKRKRVMVLVDDTNSRRTHHALAWALQHATDDADFLTFLHIIPPTHQHPSVANPPLHLLASLRAICASCKPQVEVEAVVIEGQKAVETVMIQVKKLEVSLLVLPQGRPRTFPSLFSCFCGSGIGEEREVFVEECIESAECLAVGISKQRKGMGGYLLSTRAHKNFWQLA